MAALAERFGLDRAAQLKLGQLHSILVHDPLAPTSIRDPQRVLENHLADSLVALDVEALTASRQVVDIGSGAGLPGLPLAMALPAAHFDLLESVGRKCAFIQGVISACELQNVAVIHERVESFVTGMAAFDTATCRAVAPLEVVVEYAAPLLRVGGRLVAWRGKRDFQAEERAAGAARLLGLAPEEIRAVAPYPTASNRYLHLFLKVKQMPEGFPRRVGLAAKRPLGASKPG